MAKDYAAGEPLENTHCQTPGLVTVISDSVSSSGDVEHSTETLSSPIRRSQESDLTLNVLSNPSTENDPEQVITPARSSSNAKDASISELSLSQLRARFKAGETDIVKFSHTVRCFGYKTAVRWAKRDNWKVDI